MEPENNYQYKFYIKDFDIFINEKEYGVVIDTVSDGRITFTFDRVEEVATVTGESIDHLWNMNMGSLAYEELPESEDFAEVPYILIDLHMCGVDVACSIRDIALDLDNMSRKDREYADDYDPDEWEDEWEDE